MQISAQKPSVAPDFLDQALLLRAKLREARQDKMRPNDMLEHSLLWTWMHTADMGFCVADEVGLLVSINPAACRMLGVDGMTALNQPLSQLLMQVNLTPSFAQRLLAPGGDAEGNAHRSNSSGSSVHLHLKAHSVRDGNALFKVIALSDVTQILAAQEIESTRRQWQAMNAGVVLTDIHQPDMPIVYVNPMFEQMCGYSAHEIIGRNCRFLQGRDTDQPGLVAIRRAITEQTNGYALLRNYRKDGTLFMNELFISPIKNTNGLTTHMLGIQHLRSDAFVNQEAR